MFDHRVIPLDVQSVASWLCLALAFAGAMPVFPRSLARTFVAMSFARDCWLFLLTPPISQAVETDKSMSASAGDIEMKNRWVLWALLCGVLALIIGYGIELFANVSHDSLGEWVSPLARDTPDRHPYRHFGNYSAPFWLFAGAIVGGLIGKLASGTKGADKHL